MIEWPDFEAAVVSCLGRDIQQNSNPGQHDVIRAPKDTALFIVAGPGSGKTSVIALRVLKLIFVDAVDPTSILATTFTRKAAAELRSRILGWGDRLRRAFLDDSRYTSAAPRLKDLALNQMRIDTLDAMAESLLAEYRQPGEAPPAVIDDFLSGNLMLRDGLLAQNRFRDPNLENYVKQVQGRNFRPSLSELSSVLKSIDERFHHDQVDVSQLQCNRPHPGVLVACEAIHAYNQSLQKRLVFDFARLEAEFLKRIRNNGLGAFLSQLQVLLVDEYQDTNLLQERIYFELATYAICNGGGLAVVGDDDQSLYRFRGATVDLFQDFETRLCRDVGVSAQRFYLNRNYRSNQSIVNFFNEFISLDNCYQPARVAGKPIIQFSRQSGTPITNYPVLGMFRNDVNTLARDLAQFIHRVVYGPDYTFSHAGQSFTIRINPKGGSANDICLLASSPREFDSSGRPRLPRLLREELSGFSPPIHVFNPRGTPLERVKDVERLCGLILECVDPSCTVQCSIPGLPDKAVECFRSWRTAAREYVDDNPPPTSPHTLRQYIESWQRRQPLNQQLSAAREVPLAKLAFDLITWLPSLHDDAEGLVYFEAISRTIAGSKLFAGFGAEIIFDPDNPPPQHSDQAVESIKEAIWNIFTPLAIGIVDVNEDLLEGLLSNRLNIMSIHQSKGLEFPVVIVDVGSDFRSNHPAQAFKRFPRNPSPACRLEDDFRRYSPLGVPERDALDRAFDDLIRQFFVAFSRAQDVLLLVGLDSCRNPNGVPNVATGWDRNRRWHWGVGLSNLVHV